MGVGACTLDGNEIFALYIVYDSSISDLFLVIVLYFFFFFTVRRGYCFKRVAT